MKISIDSPLHYLTSVTKDRLPVSRTDKIKGIVAKALDEARTSSGVKIHAYVIMPDHMHLITDGSRKVADTQRYFNGVTARRVIDHLKNGSFETSLLKLRQEKRRRNHRYSLWDHHPNAFSINNEKTMMQKVNYIHQNPVRAGLVERAEDYLYSSARIWQRKPLENEPLRVDMP
ncbi:MAG: transposase [Acidobacteria bacterium]|nr:transposase [Acidobacteriota bacterium]